MGSDVFLVCHILEAQSVYLIFQKDCFLSEQMVIKRAGPLERNTVQN
jgi:hypothetical protein